MADGEVIDGNDGIDIPVVDDVKNDIVDESGKDEFDFLGKVKMLLGKSDLNDEFLQMYIDLTKQSILNYCNINTLPSELNYTLCMMVVDTINEKNVTRGTGKVVGNVSSVSEDGRTVSFTNGSEFKVSIDNKISSMNELKRFKRLYRLCVDLISVQ